MEEDRKERFYAVINDVGRAIHKLRVHQGLTQEEAAARMGVTVKKLDAVERGRLTTHLSTLTDYVESIGGSLAIVPTDNPGVDHCMFIDPSQSKNRHRSPTSQKTPPTSQQMNKTRTASLSNLNE